MISFLRLLNEDFFERSELLKHAEPIPKLTQAKAGKPYALAPVNGVLVYYGPEFRWRACHTFNMRDIQSLWRIVEAEEKHEDPELQNCSLLPRVKPYPGYEAVTMLRSNQGMALDEFFTFVNKDWYQLPRFQVNGQTTISVAYENTGRRVWFFWTSISSGLSAVRTLTTLKNFYAAIVNGTYRSQLMFFEQKDNDAVSIPSTCAFAWFHITEGDVEKAVERLSIQNG